MTIPMFPLGSVLFPGAVLPLQVFEPRYRQMVEDIDAADNRFGVVLINRGFEVGGGDERHDIGTTARVVRRGVSEDGVILLLAVGEERIRVTTWLEDAPYPLAEVETMAETPPAGSAAEAIAAAAAARRRLYALAIEMGAIGQQLELDLPEDAHEAAWALCAAAPLGAFDRQRLLETDDLVIRMETLEQLLVEEAGDLERALHDGG
ncbi:MAG: LON peptidase substrate-binding domain-containing protein [Acidimicrobiia bacterium]|nr:LON peptidase substrate-binding domain-containing protein [Acidimicrobiia bacterium]